VSFDLAISDNGDLIVSGSRDLQGCSGSALVQQRIRLRLRMRRGSWSLDRKSSLGSQLHTLFGQPTEKATSAIIGFVHQALAPMADEIDVRDVTVELNKRQFVINIRYSERIDPGAVTIGSRDVQTLTVPVENVIVGGGE
jgi:phage gp46-like protein